MKRKFNLFAYFLIVLLLTTGCPEDLRNNIVAYLNINNNSPKEIVYLPYYISKENLNDTLLPLQDNHWFDSKYIIANGASKQYKIREYDKDIIETTDNLMIFLFDSDTLEQVPWERIARENIILKRVDFHSWQELEGCNFEVAYP